MTTNANLLDLRKPREASAADLSDLQACLEQLLGEPFKFARVSYGNELTLHFGELRPARSPKLKAYLYGAYIVGARGSSWIIKSGTDDLVLAACRDLADIPSSWRKPISKEDIEANPLLQPESRVLSVTAFVVKPLHGFGLQIRMTDGSTLTVIPTKPEAEEPGDATLPEIADWELSSPGGLLSAMPGLVWSFKPSARETSQLAG